MHHFKKLITGEGKDITDQMPKDAIETMTRMKWKENYWGFWSNLLRL